MSAITTTVTMTVTLAFILFWPVLVTPAAALQFATDSAAPMMVKSDRMRLQQKSGKARLTGQVQLTQGPMQLRARQMDTTLDDTGAAQQLTARGDVLLVSENGRRAKADKAHYQFGDERLTLSGHVRVIQTSENGAQQTLTGARLVINMLTGIGQLSGDKKDRARIKLSPKP